MPKNLSVDISHVGWWRKIRHSVQTAVILDFKFFPKPRKITERYSKTIKRCKKKAKTSKIPALKWILVDKKTKITKLKKKSAKMPLPWQYQIIYGTTTYHTKLFPDQFWINSVQYWKSYNRSKSARALSGPPPTPTPHGLDRTKVYFKAGFNLNAVFAPLTMDLKEIFRSLFKRYKTSMIIPRI